MDPNDFNPKYYAPGIGLEEKFDDFDPGFKSREMIDAFFLRLSMNGGSLTEACRSVTKTEDYAVRLRSYVYYYSKKNGHFKAKLEICKQMGIDAFEDTAIDRAMHGTENVKLDKNGDPVVIGRVYNEALTVALLKGLRPEKYRERVEHSGGQLITANVEIQFDNMTDDKLKEIIGIDPERQEKETV